MFIPPLSMGQFQPSPATMSQWIYQIWQFLQENPIATETEIRKFIQSELTQSETLTNAIDDYLTENPPPAPVQSVQGKTGAVQLAYNEIVPASNAVPVYKASSTPSTNTLTGQYNLGYRLFVNTTTQEIFTISPAGALSLVGRGKFDGTTVDLNTSQGDTTIAEAINDNIANITTLQNYNENVVTYGDDIVAVNTSGWASSNTIFKRVGNILYFAFQLTTSGTFPSTGHVDVTTIFTVPGYNVIGGVGSGVTGDFTNTAFIEGSEAGWRVYGNYNRVRGLLLLQPAA